MRNYISMYEDEVEPSTGIKDHQIDCTLINRQDEEDTEGEARG